MSMNIRFKAGVLGIILFSLALILSLASCSSTSGKSAQAVETYLQAIVSQDANKMIAASCANWEPQARLEFDSFSAVKLTLNDLKCSETGQAKPYTLVTCTGSITANYGAEDQQIDIAGRTYQVIEEGGEWRMCGYR
jgi:hypothetical protein